MDTGLIRVPLTALRTNDEQTVGSVYQNKSKYYRWQKNAGATALVARACCLQMFTSGEDAINTRVIATDGAAAETSSITVPAGMPMAAMGPSGSDTGAYGWVQCKGPARVTLAKSSAAMVAGSVAIATDAQPETQPWGSVGVPVLTGIGADQTSTYPLAGRRVVLMQVIAATNPATSVSCLVDIQCM